MYFEGSILFSVDDRNCRPSKPEENILKDQKYINGNMFDVNDTSDTIN